MPNLIDGLIGVVDSLRGSLYPSIGNRSYRLYRIIRTWSGAEVGRGTVTSTELEITPLPEIDFMSRRDDLSPGGRIERGRMSAKEVSLTFTEEALRGYPLAAGQECFYRLDSIQTQAEATSYWVIDGPPIAQRDNFQWVITFKRYEPSHVDNYSSGFAPGFEV